ncbi:hypothetical protein ES708_16750 [subsurface metagenome]
MGGSYLSLLQIFPSMEYFVRILDMVGFKIFLIFSIHGIFEDIINIWFVRDHI